MIGYIPPIIPIIEPRYPECNRLENIIKVCKECGYVYDEKPEFPLGCILFIVIFVIIIAPWGAWTAMEWFSGNGSLVEVLINQWRWLLSRRIY